MQSITNRRICESCGISDGGSSDTKLLECAGCLSSYFCNTKCQQQSWPLHKKVCRQRKKSVVKIQSNWRGWYTRRQLELNDGQDRCEVCGVLDGKDKQLNICDGCKLSLFCSVRCQEYAWKKKNHKIICQERQKAVLKIQSVWRASIRERYEDDRERYDDDNVSVKNDKDSNTNIGEEEVLDADELKDELKERIMRVDSYVPLSIRKNAGLSTPETIRCLIMSGDTLIDTALMIFIICIVSRNQFLTYAMISYYTYMIFEEMTHSLTQNDECIFAKSRIKFIFEETNCVDKCLTALAIFGLYYERHKAWNWYFSLHETCLMKSLISQNVPKTNSMFNLTLAVSMLVSLCLQGRFWRYVVFLIAQIVLCVYLTDKNNLEKFKKMKEEQNVKKEEKRSKKKVQRKKKKKKTRAASSNKESLGN